MPALLPTLALFALLAASPDPHAGGVAPAETVGTVGIVVNTEKVKDDIKEVKEDVRELKEGLRELQEGREGCPEAVGEAGQ